MPVAPISLLETWERAQPLPAPARPLALLALAEGSAEPEDLARLALGARDAELLRLRRQLFGGHMSCTTVCPKCAAHLQLDLSADDFLGQAGGTAVGLHRLERDGYVIEFRALNSTDVAALAPSEAEEIEKCILARCVIEARGPAGRVDPQQIPPALAELLAQELERRDPLAAIWLDLECGQCGHAWPSLFDIASLLWIEIDRWASALLREVHQLARAYGWSERDVLGMSPARRHSYLRMIEA